MKDSKWLVVAGLVIMMMAVGCKKVGDQVDVAGTEANPLSVPILMGAEKLLVGHVKVWDDDVNLHVRYALDVAQPAGTEVRLLRVEFDVKMDSIEFPYTNTATPTIVPSEFLYIKDGVPYPYQEWAFPLADYGGWLTGTKAAAAAHCVLHHHQADGQWVLKSGWAYDPAHPFKYADAECAGGWFWYKFEVPHDGEWHVNTAWGGKKYPDWDDWMFPGKNWALYINYNLSATEYVGSLYAGNPKTDALAKVVGTVTVSDDVVAGVGNIYVKYTITKTDRAMFSGHTIVRGRLADIPQTKGGPIPGQFDEHWGPFDPPEDGVTVTIPYDPAWGTNLFIGAHAEVGWYY